MTDGGENADGGLIDVLADLAGEGRTPVSDHGHRDDPRLDIQTPAGVIRSARKPDGTRTEGSAHQRWWTWGSYRLTEERDGHPDLDAEDRHAVLVEQVARGEQ